RGTPLHAKPTDRSRSTTSACSAKARTCAAIPLDSTAITPCSPRRPNGVRSCGGASAFIGGGEVGADFGSFTWPHVLPGGGVGARFTLAKRNHVNLRVDYAWGKNSTALYMAVAEAF